MVLQAVEEYLLREEKKDTIKNIYPVNFQKNIC